MTIPEADFLNKVLRYEPETGRLFWREREPDAFPDGKRPSAVLAKIWNTRFAGKEAFTASQGNGYKQSNFFGRKAFAHRIIWKMVTGNDPDVIDHINRDPSDNRWSNLRSVTQQINMQNSGMRSDNTSTVTGVSLYRTGKWVAYINAHGKRVGLGTFDSIEDAAEARRDALDRFGYSEGHGLSEPSTCFDH